MTNKDKFQAHIDHLQMTHDELDANIKSLEQKYGNDKLVTENKKKKLFLKDEIEKCKKQLTSL